MEAAGNSLCTDTAVCHRTLLCKMPSSLRYYLSYPDNFLFVMVPNMSAFYRATDI
jgi:hypothetical protein